MEIKKAEIKKALSLGIKYGETLLRLMEELTSIEHPFSGRLKTETKKEVKFLEEILVKEFPLE